MDQFTTNLTAKLNTEENKAKPWQGTPMTFLGENNISEELTRALQEN